MINYNLASSGSMEFRVPPTSQCRAVRRDGTRCPHPSKFAAFCGLHFPKPAVEPKESRLVQRIGLAADVITIAAGSTELIKMIVEVWLITTDLFAEHLANWFLHRVQQMPDLDREFYRPCDPQRLIRRVGIFVVLQ
jgi:hypothetical protein